MSIQEENDDQISRINPYRVAVGEKIQELRDLYGAIFVNSRERSLAVTNLDQSELWLTKCEEVNPVVYPPENLP